MAKFRLKSGKYHGLKDGKKHTYAPGEIVELDPSQVQYMMDVLEPLEPLVTKEEQEAAPRKQLKAAHKGGGKYNVINKATGKPINDVLLSKEEAQNLVSGKIDSTENEDKKEILEPEKEKEDGKETNIKDLAKSDGVHSRRRSKSK